MLTPVPSTPVLQYSVVNTRDLYKKSTENKNLIVFKCASKVTEILKSKEICVSAITIILCVNQSRVNYARK